MPKEPNPLARLVLTNAIHFKGDWLFPFKKKETIMDDFHLAGGKKTKVPLMIQSGANSAAAASSRLRFSPSSHPAKRVAWLSATTACFVMA